MKINVSIVNEASAALDLLDQYWAFAQYKSRHQDYKPDFEIVTHQGINIDPDSLNIGWFMMPTTDQDFDQFDLILLDNTHHSLEKCNEIMHRCLLDRDNCFLITGAYLTDDHIIKNKSIWLPLQGHVRNLLLRPCYPQFFERELASNKSRHNMIFINGQARANRQYFLNLLLIALPEIPVKNTFPGLVKLEPSVFESDQDTEFRETVNKLVTANSDYDSIRKYYDNPVLMGITGKFGQAMPGYMLIDDYVNYHCVIFPETQWLNNQLFITEKSSKCFVGRSIPWPIGGANMIELYRTVGYQTAYDLLPDEFRYDAIQDHATRHQMCANAIAWAYSNPDIWISDQAQQIIENNYNNFFTNTYDAQGVKQLDSILTKTICTL